MNPYQIEGIQPGEFLTIKVDHPITSFVAVSSEVASRWLQHNTHNRRLSPQAVMEYMTDMEAGRFALTGEPIQFSKTGVLLNGQNRLTALSNIPGLVLVFNVIRGLDDEVQGYMDLGKKRTPGQQLALSGVKNANQVASMVRVFITWESGLLWTDQTARRSISTPRVEQWVVDNADTVEYFNTFLARATRRVGGTPAVAGAMALAGLRFDVEAIVAFYHLLASRIGLPEGSPLLALDTRLRNTKAERKRMDQREELAYFLSAWNLWMEGASVTRLQASKGGWSARNFPVMRQERGRNFPKDQLVAGLERAGA